MAFEYSTVKPLMDEVNTQWSGYYGEGMLFAKELENSAVAPWFNFSDGERSMIALNTAIKALSDYIDTLAPQ